LAAAVVALFAAGVALATGVAEAAGAAGAAVFVGALVVQPEANSKTDAATRDSGDFKNVFNTSRPIYF
jgi:hypothetical protein